MLRRCSLCEEVKEEGLFAFDKCNNTFKYCKACMRMLQRTWYNSRKEIKAELQKPDMKEKVCTSCRINKPIEEFYYNKNHNRYESSCKACKKEYYKEYYKKYKPIKDKRNKKKVYKVNSSMTKVDELVRKINNEFTPFNKYEFKGY